MTAEKRYSQDKYDWYIRAFYETDHVRWVRWSGKPTQIKKYDSDFLKDTIQDFEKLMNTQGFQEECIK